MLSSNDYKKDLLNWKSQFGKNIHIERPETQELLRFLAKDTKKGKESVLFLVGNAGMEKTVVMSDVLKSIEAKEEWHTYVLKADMLKLENDITLITERILDTLANKDDGRKSYSS